MDAGGCCSTDLIVHRLLWQRHAWAFRIHFIEFWLWRFDGSVNKDPLFCGAPDLKQNLRMRPCRTVSFRRAGEDLRGIQRKVQSLRRHFLTWKFPRELWLLELVLLLEKRGSVCGRSFRDSSSSLGLRFGSCSNLQAAKISSDEAFTDGGKEETHLKVMLKDRRVFKMKQKRWKRSESQTLTSDPRPQGKYVLERGFQEPKHQTKEGQKSRLVLSESKEQKKTDALDKFRRKI